MTATNQERFLLDEAEQERRLGEELLAAAREVVAAYDVFEENRLRLLYAIERLEELVGRP